MAQEAPKYPRWKQAVLIADVVLLGDMICSFVGFSGALFSGDYIPSSPASTPLKILLAQGLAAGVLAALTSPLAWDTSKFGSQDEKPSDNQWQ